MFTPGEQTQLNEIHARLDRITLFLQKNDFPDESDASVYYSYLSSLKSVMGNFNIGISFTACLMAKSYLISRYQLQDYDASAKPQGAPGLDIEVNLKDGRKLIAEIKTTVPYKNDDLGSNQQKEFENDFTKLHRSDADIKFFFLAERSAFKIMRKPKYSDKLIGIHVVLLPSGEEIF